MQSSTVTLPFPDKSLWPNGRAHWAVKAKAFRLMKSWAYAALLAEKPAPVSGRVDWSITIHPKTRNAIDADNAVAACKAVADGLALAMKVDDKVFNAPSVTFAEPVKGGLLRVTVTYDQA